MKKRSGLALYMVIRLFGIVVITANPTPETAAKTLRATTLAPEATVRNMEAAKVTRPRRYVSRRPIREITRF